jgi:hypothetical protein
MLFYKSANRSTAATAVATRRKPQRADHRNEGDGQLLVRQLAAARMQAERERAAQLSAFERELLLAWAQDY